MFYVQYFTYSGLTTTLWCGHFFPIAVEETRLFKSPPSAEIWILILFHFEGLCCLPHLGRSTTSRFCSQIPGLQLRFLSFTWSPNLLNLSVSQFPYLLNGGPKFSICAKYFGMSGTSCAFDFYCDFIATCHWIYKPSSPLVPPPTNVLKNYSPKC